jgi:hypothetical protein
MTVGATIKAYTRFLTLPRSRPTCARRIATAMRTQRAAFEASRRSRRTEGRLVIHKTHRRSQKASPRAVRKIGKDENSHATALRVKRSPKAMLGCLARKHATGEAKGTITPSLDRPDLSRPRIGGP